MIGHLPTNLQYQGFLNTGPWAFIWQFLSSTYNNVCAKYWPMGFYSEESCQTEAHEPLLNWASGRKAPVAPQVGGNMSVSSEGSKALKFVATDELVYRIYLWVYISLMTVVSFIRTLALSIAVMQDLNFIIGTSLLSHPHTM